MKRLIHLNMAWNALFILMGLSEMFGLTGMHEQLPSWGKWVWFIVLAGGNLVIHIAELRKIDFLLKPWRRVDD